MSSDWAVGSEESQDQPSCICEMAIFLNPIEIDDVVQYYQLIFLFTDLHSCDQIVTNAEGVWRINLFDRVNACGYSDFP